MFLLHLDFYLLVLIQMTAEDGKLGRSGIFFANTQKFVGICFPGKNPFPLFLRLGNIEFYAEGLTTIFTLQGENNE